MKRLALIALLFAPALARADDAGPRNSISIRPFALSSHGFQAEYERYFPWHALSVAAGPAIRESVGGDFHALSASAGVEARLWLRGSTAPRYTVRPMDGPYLGARFDSGFTHLASGDRAIGTSWTSLTTIGAGWRVSVWKLHLTPSLAVGAETQAGGAVAAGLHPTAVLGLAVGALF